MQVLALTRISTTVGNHAMLAEMLAHHTNTVRTDQTLPLDWGNVRSLLDLNPMSACSAPGVGAEFKNVGKRPPGDRSERTLAISN